MFGLFIFGSLKNIFVMFSLDRLVTLVTYEKGVNKKKNSFNLANWIVKFKISWSLFSS